MSNNEFDNDPMGQDAGFEDFEGGEQSMSDMLRNNPMVKIGVVLGAIATIVGGIVLFGGEKETGGTSVMRPGSDLSQAPGANEVSDTYREQIQDFNQAQIDQAQSTGQSALPVPVGTTRGVIPLDDAKVSEEDPLERWRRLQAERIEKEKQAAPTEAGPVAPPVDPNAEVKQQLAKAMAGQMESILDFKTLKGPNQESVSDPDWIEQKREEQKQKAEEERLAAEGDAQASDVLILLPAGTIEYAQLMTEANTDAPGPVLAQIVSGPLAGSRAIGSFKASDEYITLQFNTVVVDGIAYGTDAIALDPKTANPGMITEIDKKYFTRVILPAAAAFIEGLGGAIAETGSTTLTVATGGSSSSSTSEDLDTEQEFFKAVEEAAEKVGEMLDEEADNAEPMLRVAAGTPMALLFVKPVQQNTSKEEPAVASQTSNQNPFGNLIPAFIPVQNQGQQPATAAPATQPASTQTDTSSTN
ncbi:DotG/IcmE/VirB10 family protein [Micavibrio aeruginosavorus]|uniref:DotG/IcmE/VirB10 family protein n=1 Tax=Micavibrio aeruginosavorus TaxID=349221 RepID=UPI003F4AA79D